MPKWELICHPDGSRQKLPVTSIRAVNFNQSCPSIRAVNLITRMDKREHAATRLMPDAIAYPICALHHDDDGASGPLCPLRIRLILSRRASSSVRSWATVMPCRLQSDRACPRLNGCMRHVLPRVVFNPHLSPFALHQSLSISRPASPLRRRPYSVKPF